MARTMTRPVTTRPRANTIVDAFILVSDYTAGITKNTHPCVKFGPDGSERIPKTGDVRTVKLGDPFFQIVIII